jgi:hypothetical protein
VFASVSVIELAEIEMAESRVIVQYGDLLVEQVGDATWAVRRPTRTDRYESLVDALFEFDRLLGDQKTSEAHLVWPSDQEATLELLASDGFKEFGVTVKGGFAMVDSHWIPCEFLDFYGGDIDAHLEVAASVNWTTGSRDYYAYKDIFIVTEWRPEKGVTYEIEYDLPEDEDYDEIDDGEIEFARFIGLNKLDRDEWFDLPEDAVKFCDLTSWWEYGECEIAELAVYSSELKGDLNVLVTDRNREKVIGKFASLRDVVDSMTIEDGVRYNLVSDTLDEWWGWNLGSPKFDF